MSVRITIGGDVCPINRNESLFITGDVDSVFRDLILDFNDADLNIINLECPLIAHPSPIKKYGPVLSADRRAAMGIGKAGIHAINLANNHIKDHGPNGVCSTMEACRESGVDIFGAGESIHDAAQPLIKSVKGIRVGMIGFADYEFSIANETQAGANPLDIIHCVNSIEETKSKVDLLIVLIHAGPAYYPYPTPKLQRISRFLVDRGADTVVLQHSHCAGCIEEYHGGHIVYGQGDFIFDWYLDKRNEVNKGFLIRIEIHDSGQRTIELIPFEQSAAYAGVKKLKGDGAETFLNEIRTRSDRIADADEVQKLWQEHCQSVKKMYMNRLFLGSINGKIFRTISRYLPFYKLAISRQHALSVENLLRCETHREILEFLLSEFNKNRINDIATSKQ